MKRSKAGGGRKRSSPGLLVVCAAVALYALLVWLAVRPVAGWYEIAGRGEMGLAAAAAYDPGNPVYPYLQGRYYALSIDNPDPAKAILSYRRALSLNPLQPGAWAGLSRSFLHTGNLLEAEHALERAVLLRPSDPDLMWEASTFWLMNGQTDKAAAALRKLILLRPDMQPEIYDLCWKLQVGNSYVIRNVLPAEYPYERRYLEYLIGAKRPEETGAVWQLIDRNSIDRGLFIGYINFLIDSGLYDRAAQDWKEVAPRAVGLKAGEDKSLLWNPDFEYDVLGGGFGWAVSETGGVDVFIDDSVHVTGNRSLGASFSGEENPDVTLARQVVRVVPGAAYSLRGYIKTQSLTTASGIFLEVRGHRCNGLDRRSDTVTGTNFWREAAVDFDVPQDCAAAVVMVRRERSNKFDNKISGTAWIDGLSLRERAAGATIASRKP